MPETPAGRENGQGRALESNGGGGEAHFRRLLDNLPAAAYTCDREGLITYFNQHALQLWGRAPRLHDPQDRFCGSFRLFAIDGAPIPHERCWMALVLEQKRAFNGHEILIERPDGQRVTALAYANPISDDAGNLIGAVNVLIDISDRKSNERSQRTSEERFRFLAEMIPSIVWTAAPNGSITYANQRWLEYCGLTAEQNARHWPELVLHPDDHERCMQAWADAIRKGRIYEIEVRNRRHDGLYRWFVTRAVPLKDDNGDVICWFGVTTDIHDQKEMQEQLKEADKRKDQFLATLAHELRNPLAPLRNGLYLLPKVRTDETAFEEVRAMMENQLHHMVHLLDDLMDISRIARNKVQLRKRRVQLAWVVNDAVETTRPLIEERKHQLVVTLPAQPVYLDADSVRLSQVLSNLLNNAAKYTEPGGKITVTAELSSATVGGVGREVAIRVRDTGLGIPKEALPRIFDLFVQADRHTTHAGGGLGIGLSLVKSLVEMHGGRVSAHSDGPDKGSEFVVRLPVTSDAPSPLLNIPKPQPAPTKMSPRRILIVDDNRDGAESLAMLLRGMGHEICVAFDGMQAMTEADRFEPDAAILDLGLPGLDGHELARRLRAKEGGDRLMLIAMTGWGRDADRQRSLDAGFDAHFVKPVSVTDVCGLLANLRDEG